MHVFVVCCWLVAHKSATDMYILSSVIACMLAATCLVVVCLLCALQGGQSKEGTPTF